MIFQLGAHGSLLLLTTYSPVTITVENIVTFSLVALPRRNTHRHRGYVCSPSGRVVAGTVAHRERHGCLIHRSRFWARPRTRSHLSVPALGCTRWCLTITVSFQLAVQATFPLWTLSVASGATRCRLIRYERNSCCYKRWPFALMSVLSADSSKTSSSSMSSSKAAFSSTLNELTMAP